VHPSLPPGLGVEDESHLREVDLALHAGLTIDDPHRGGPDPEPAPLDREPVHRSIRHHAALPGQQLLDLHDRQRLLAISAGDPLADLLLTGEQQIPRRAVPVGPTRADRRDHRTDQLIRDRRAGLPTETLRFGRSDISAGGLAVHPRPLRGLPQTGSLEPTAEHLTHLNHTDLPESHAR
jgi:hypothetical protein